jgi:hypothetical protein
VDDWLSEARDRLAAFTGEDPMTLELSQGEIDELLELARIAAHESGERTNAPLICYLAGVAHARAGGDLTDLVDAVIAKA